MICKNMELSKYKYYLEKHDWQYHYITGYYGWKFWQQNEEFLRELSMLSAKHRCLYFSFYHFNNFFNK